MLLRKFSLVKKLKIGLTTLLLINHPMLLIADVNVKTPKESPAINILSNTTTNPGSSSSNSSEVIEVEEIKEVKVNDKKHYTIELILFRHNNPNALTSEFWEAYNEDSLSESIETGNESEINIANNSGANDLPEVEQFSLPTTPFKKRIKASYLASYNIQNETLKSYDSSVTLVDQRNLQLLKEVKHILYSKRYRLLTHFAWTQPGYNARETKAMKLNFPRSYGNLNGHITIALSRYLHTEIDLQLIEDVCRKEKIIDENFEDDGKIKIEVLVNEQTEPKNKTKDEAYNPNKTTIEKKPEQFKLSCQTEIIPFNQKRKMRSKKLHYIDHPAFGLLVLITPYNKTNKVISKSAPKVQHLDKKNVNKSKDNQSKATKNKITYQRNRALD